MSSFKNFFKENAEQIESIEYVATSRFKDDKGAPIRWKLRPLTNTEFDDLTNRANKTKFGGKGKREVKFDLSTFRPGFCVAGVVYPDLNDAELQKNWGVMGADNLIKEMLLPGELTDLYDKLNEISGFDKDINEEIEEAKNS